MNPMKRMFHRHTMTSDLSEEMQQHLEEKIEALVADGMSHEEAVHAARRAFGNTTLIEQRSREVWMWPLIESIWADVKFALRGFRRNILFTITVVAALALGIGATTAMFSLIYAALLHPFPYAGANHIVNPRIIDEKHPQIPTWFALTPAQFNSFRKAKSIDSVLGFILADLETTGSDLPEDVSTAYVTSNASSFFGIPAMLGRGIQPSDVPDSGQSTNVVVLSYRFWKDHYSGDKTTIVGRTLQLNHKNYTIVGVMPSRFTFTETVGNADVYIPWTPTRAGALFPWIKLKAGVSLATANAEFQSLLNQFKQETPKHFPAAFRVSVQPIIEPYIHRTGSTLALLFASVVVLLLIGCANCSVLLLARGEARHHELAIRSAIGASRFRMVRQLLIEAFAISFAGTAMGVAASFWLAEFALRMMPYAFPQEAAVTINFPILAFSIGLALIAGLLSGLSPALRLSRPNVSKIIQSTARTTGGNTSKRTTNLLIGSQIALTFVLLGVAGAAIAGFLKVISTRLGYDPHNVMAIRVPLKRDTDKNQQQRANYINQLRERVASVPGVISVAVASSGIPPSQPDFGLGTIGPFEILGEQPKQQPQAAVSLVSPRYFATLKIPLLRGRIWDQAENQRGDFVAVVNQTLAQRYWPHGDAIGHQIRILSLKDDGGPLLATSPQSGGLRQIIGVVADSRNDGLERPVAPAIYVPYTTFMWDGTELLVHTAGAPLAFIHAIRIALQSLSPDQRTAEVGDLEEALHHQSIWTQQRLFSILFSFFAGLALISSLIGLTSTVSFAAARRTNELGIRMALGAQRSHIVWIVVRATLATVGSGIVVGLVLDLALENVLRHWTPGSVFTPWMIAVVAFLLIVCTIVACLFPARRAAMIDPMVALRGE
ncbi:MAG TPA: ABC transporter permease [Acidobacteriaceae bacterium]|nr:ABC transporter permease [Acidobacteriaceae bacterium]